MALGHPMTVIFRASEERAKRSQMDIFLNSQPKTKPSMGHSGAISAPLNDRYTFDQFVIGKSNELAATAAHAVSRTPGKVYNPLFIYGPTGTGKTHLMQAIAHEILTHKPDTRIRYISTEQFTNEFITAIQGQGVQGDPRIDFRRRYREESDVFLIDDVHFLKGKDSTKEEFFHTFNTLYEAGRQIVLTSDRPPTEISGLEARLVTRLQWGMVADIQLPDFEHRVAILKRKAEIDHLEMTIPDEVIYFVAENVTASVRELEGSIIKLLAFASLRHREINVDLAREALRDKLRNQETGSGGGGGGALSVGTIQQAVAREWGVTAEGLRSKTRTKTLTVPRQVAMYLTRELLRTQLVEIGNAFGGRDHSTVIHSIEKVAENISRDPDFQNRVNKMRRSIQQNDR
ncbi:MAG: chromosomal replication initiator protein DnaA, partial [Arenimonas sp.]